MRCMSVCLCLWLGFANQVGAVVIASGDGTGNTTAPPDDPGFSNVGIVGSGTAVYLGFGWVLTATHVGAGSTLFNNAWYNEVPGSAVQLANPTPHLLASQRCTLVRYQFRPPRHFPGATVFNRRQQPRFWLLRA